MAYENVRAPYKNIVAVGSSFFIFDHVNSIVLEKSSNSKTLRTYALTTPITSLVKCLQFDGVHFWTLQADGTNSEVIKMWRLMDSYCDLIKTYTLSPSLYSNNHYFNSETFATEVYTTEFSDAVPKNSTYIDMVQFANDLSPWDILLLGPNSDNEYEEVTVSGVLSSTRAGLTFYTTYNYLEGDPISYVKNFWVFNDNYYTTSDGGLYKINPHTKEIRMVYQDVEYKGVLACSFCNMSSVPHVGNVYSLAYVKGSSIRFIDISPGASLDLYCIMNIDNVKADGVTIIPVYELDIDGESVYRFQLAANYYGTNHTWSTYNYQLSILSPFLDSISVDAFPVILPADAVSSSEVTAIVRDQYGEPMVSKQVEYTDDDTIGYITLNPMMTDLNGQSLTYYKAGTDVRTVTVVGTATHFD